MSNRSPLKSPFSDPKFTVNGGSGHHIGDIIIILDYRVFAAILVGGSTVFGTGFVIYEIIEFGYWLTEWFPNHYKEVLAVICGLTALFIGGRHFITYITGYDADWDL